MARVVDITVAIVVGVATAVLDGPGVAATLLTVTALDLVPVALWGTTPGKRLVGVRVVGPDGRAPGWARAGLRHAVVSPFLLGLFVDGAGALRPRGTGAHDRVALTAVVRGPRQPVLPVPGPIPRRTAGGGDVAAAVWAGVWLSTVAAVLAAELGSDLGTSAYFTVLLPAQSLGTLLVVVSVARVKGTGDWRSDFGWRLRLRDAPWLLLGPGLQIAIGIVLLPILVALDVEPDQEVTREIRRAVEPIEAVAAFLAVAVVAPIEEELLFRGILLRAQLRRFTEGKALALNAAVFAGVHLLDPGVWPILPGLLFLGWVLAYLTVRSGTLSRAVFVHAGFNVLAVMLNLTA